MDENPANEIAQFWHNKQSNSWVCGEKLQIFSFFYLSFDFIIESDIVSKSVVAGWNFRYQHAESQAETGYQWSEMYLVTYKGNDQEDSGSRGSVWKWEDNYYVLVKIRLDQKKGADYFEKVDS